MKKVLSMVLTSLVVSALFVACGGSGSAIVGSWATTQEVDGGRVEVVINFESDGKGTTSLSLDASDEQKKQLAESGMSIQDLEDIVKAVMGDEFPETFTYSVNGDKLTMTVNGKSEESNFSIKGNKMTITEDSSEVVFTKK